MRFLKLAAFLCVAAVAGAALPRAAVATPIGPSCGTCQGSIYELSYDGTPIATTATTETFRITYTIDTSGYTGTGVYLDTVALKVASSFINAELIVAPGGVANWKEMEGGLSQAGCSGSGSGYDCVRIKVLTTAPTVPDGTYTWIFDIEVPTGALLIGTDEASVKARYVGTNWMKRGDLVSENITLTNLPEPSATLLLLLPALTLRRRARRR